MEHTRKTRLHNMVDECSAEDILNMYRFAKRNMDIGSFIKLRSFFTRMVEAQTELDDYDGSPKWVTPHEYFSSLVGISACRGKLSLTNCEKAIESLLDVFSQGCFGYKKNEDYGKTL